ncbi:hypothetical protein [Natrinema sp. 1APR25-10V2]|uniref:hypothetical protein n=1 Tax=Natrinema sp. 1APR25-10V2 TaxID=2951081 RepID=UPI0028757B44|nr:hypothetical protein [Natrinema sp. 1APR25-10V2]MDS0474965.1 hypothetical protein [Natrinema sp. 1APR25-10V2]
MKNDADVGMLYAEIANPFDGQARGWGVKTEWCERYNEAVAGSSGDSDSGDGSSGDGDNETTATGGGNGTEGGNSTNESEGMSAADSAAMILMSNVLNTRVYEEDLED